jgi:hypothetical protein
MPDLPPDPARDFGFHHLLAGLRDGRAGWGVRIALSFAAAACLTGLMLLIVGGLEINGFLIRDAHIAIIIPLTIATWLGSLYLIWATFGRWRWLLRNIFTCLVIWAVAIGACIVLDSASRRAEVAIAGIIFLAFTASALVVTTSIYQLSRGRPIFLADGKISVHCPGCGYNMSGLDSSSCPECGQRYTLDQLIKGQNYEALRPAIPSSVPKPLTQAPGAAPQAPEPQALPGGAAIPNLS